MALSSADLYTNPKIPPSDKDYTTTNLLAAIAGGAPAIAGKVLSPGSERAQATLNVLKGKPSTATDPTFSPRQGNFTSYTPEEAQLRAAAQNGDPAAWNKFLQSRMGAQREGQSSLDAQRVQKSVSDAIEAGLDDKRASRYVKAAEGTKKAVEELPEKIAGQGPSEASQGGWDMLGALGEMFGVPGAGFAGLALPHLEKSGMLPPIGTPTTMLYKYGANRMFNNPTSAAMLQALAMQAPEAFTKKQADKYIYSDQVSPQEQFNSGN
jgi:hypothetical protein